MVEEQDGEPYRDVYGFCNRYSHGEGSETVDVLDARGVHGQIRRCMKFLRAADGEHVERMCKATGVDPLTDTSAPPLQFAEFVPSFRRSWMPFCLACITCQMSYDRTAAV